MLVLMWRDSMKYEWRKKEKQLYLPKNRPEVIEIPEMKFFMIEGQGNPNSEFFGDYISALYSLSYAVRMSHDKPFEYTVYPLEGVWDLTKKGRAEYNGTLDKNELTFNLMIRQPDFVSSEFAAEIMERTMVKKPHRLLEQVRFDSLREGRCVQMLHVGPYDNEAESFGQMERFCIDSELNRKALTHREIYLSDFRRTEPEKLKTVLRFLID